MGNYYEDCPLCAGTGVYPDTEEHDICPKCEGEQKVPQTPREVEVHEHGCCDHCGRTGPLHVLLNVWIDDDGTEVEEHKVSLCHSCYQK